MAATERPAGEYPTMQPDDEASQRNSNYLSSYHANQNDNNDSGQLLKQSSLLHQSSSYLKQATSGFMRWQSRRAFWSAVDQPQSERLSTGVTCANTRLALAYWFKTVGRVARRHPSVILIPLLFGSACLAGGLAGVILAAKDAENSRRDDAATTGRQAAGVLELLVEDRALQPAAALASLAQEQPNVTALAAAMPQLLPRLLLQTQANSSTSSSYVVQFVLAPFGVVSAVVVPQGAPASGSGGLASGTNLWTAAATSRATSQAVQGQVAVPVVSVSTRQGSNGGSEVLMFSQFPVYISGVEPGETWGNAGSGAAPNCGTACYDASSRTKLWGFAISVVSLSSLLSIPDADLDSLTEKHYRFRLSVQTSGPQGSSDMEVAASPKRPPSLRNGISVPVQLTGSVSAGAAVTATAVDGAEAEMSVYNSEGWQPVWEGPLIAVVVVVSVALAAMLFVMMFAYWRHMTILRAMLPNKVISVLSRGAHYYEHFDSVTVLYADVVRYTVAKAHQGEEVPTFEVVKLLNDVHSMYKSIIEKYGLVRIRRSGESFLCVGGCPTPDDPMAVAVRVAACARDMVMATSRFRGSGGFRVQIRVGLHTGPVVAAVVGSKLPRFSLFGDVVDVAYFMEATSRAMAIHISDRTSELLSKANDPLLQLRPRGKLDIIGQGSMFTNWLQLDALPDPGVADNEERVEEQKKKKGKAATDAAAAAVPGTA